MMLAVEWDLYCFFLTALLCVCMCVHKTMAQMHLYAREVSGLISGPQEADDKIGPNSLKARRQTKERKKKAPKRHSNNPKIPQSVPLRSECFGRSVLLIPSGM